MRLLIGLYAAMCLLLGLFAVASDMVITFWVEDGGFSQTMLAKIIMHITICGGPSWVAVVYWLIPLVTGLLGLALVLDGRKILF